MQRPIRYALEWKGKISVSKSGSRIRVLSSKSGRWGSHGRSWKEVARGRVRDRGKRSLKASVIGRGKRSL